MLCHPAFVCSAALSHHGCTLTGTPHDRPADVLEMVRLQRGPVWEVAPLLCSCEAYNLNPTKGYLHGSSHTGIPQHLGCCPSHSAEDPLDLRPRRLVVSPRALCSLYSGFKWSNNPNGSSSDSTFQAIAALNRKHSRGQRLYSTLGASSLYIGIRVFGRLGN